MLSRRLPSTFIDNVEDERSSTQQKEEQLARNALVNENPFQDFIIFKIASIL